MSATFESDQRTHSRPVRSARTSTRPRLGEAGGQPVYQRRSTTPKTARLDAVVIEVLVGPVEGGGKLVPFAPHGGARRG